MMLEIRKETNRNLLTPSGMGAGADTHQGEGTPDEADLGELSDNPSDSPLPVSRTNQRELFEKYRHLWPRIMIKAPMCALHIGPK